MALSYLVGTVTQGSNDAFAESEITTALSGQTQRAFRIREILVEWPNTPATNAIDVQLCLSRRSQTAFPNITDRNVIWSQRRTVTLATSGLWVNHRVTREAYSEDDQLLIVEDPIYFDIDSASTSATNTAYIRIGYELINVSANDRLVLALQSLNEAT